MTNFLKTSVAILAVAVVFSSCKKSSTPKPDNGTTTTSMKFTVNGTVVSLNDCEETDASVNDAPQTLFIGVNVTNGKPGDVSFEVDVMAAPSALKAGQTYPASSSFSQPNSSALFYYPNANDSYNTQPSNAQGTVSITEVTSTTISGTFSGKLFASDDFNGEHIIYTITSGSFTAKRNTKP